MNTTFIIKCKECEFVAISKSDIDNHMAEKHDALENPETSEIKLFILVEYYLDLFEARKAKWSEKSGEG